LDKRQLFGRDPVAGSSDVVANDANFFAGFAISNQIMGHPGLWQASNCRQESSTLMEFCIQLFGGVGSA
jgi:hypothetical protein